MSENVNLDWDAGISADAGNTEFELPPIGEYDFTVLSYERTFSKAGNNMAVVSLVLDINGQNYPRKDNIVLTSNMEWKIATFFESIGLKKKGEPLTKMPWDKIAGRSGRCKIKHEEYNGSTYVRIDKYLPKKVEGVAAKAPTKPAPASDDSLPFEI